WGSLRDSVQSGGQRRGDDLQGHPERHAGDAIQLLLRKRVHGRRAPRSGARPGHQRRLLRDNKRWRVGLWDGLQNHTGRHADDAVPLLFPKRVPGRLKPLRGAGPDRQWGLLRDSKEWRGQRPWDGLQNHPKRHTHDAAQLRQDRRQRPRNYTGPGHRRELLRDNVWWRGPRRRDDFRDGSERHAGDATQLLPAWRRLHGRQKPRSGPVAGHEWDVLRDHEFWWGQPLWDGLQLVCAPWLVRENTACEGRGGSGHQNSRDRFDRRDQRQLQWHLRLRSPWFRVPKSPPPYPSARPPARSRW